MEEVVTYSSLKERDYCDNCGGDRTVWREEYDDDDCYHEWEEECEECDGTGYAPLEELKE